MKEIARKIVAHFSQKNLRLCTVESITGGRISSAITAIRGASDIFFAGAVLYDSEAKRKFLQIDFENVYSAETAEKMAQSFRNQCEADFCIATTGRAEDGQKTFFAVATREYIFSTEKIFFGNREKIQSDATDFALQFLFEKEIEII